MDALLLSGVDGKSNCSPWLPHTWMESSSAHGPTLAFLQKGAGHTPAISLLPAIFPQTRTAPWAHIAIRLLENLRPGSLVIQIAPVCDPTRLANCRLAVRGEPCAADNTQAGMIIVPPTASRTLERASVD